MMQEQTIWKGNPSFVINLIMDILSIFVIFCILFFNVPIYFIALPLIFILWNFLSVKTTVYQLTTERLKSSYGILNKRIVDRSEKKYWNKWYTAVLFFLVLQIIFYYFITQYFN